MFSRIGNRKVILSTLFMMLLIWGVQGNLSYASNLSFSGGLTPSKTSVLTGEKFELSFTVQSQSTIPDTTANFVTLAAYPIGSLTSVGETVIKNLATGKLQPGSITVTAPPVTTTYMVRIVSSAPDGSDTDPNDNISKAVTISVTAGTVNLSVSVVPSLYSVVPQQSFNLVATVRNNGTAPSGDTTLQAYQRSGSTNVISSVGTRALIRSIAVDSTAIAYITLRTPAVPGIYYYRVQIGNDTTKNSNWTPVTVTNPVDLSVATPTVDKATVAPGETFTLSTTVSNVATGNFTGSHNIRLRYFRSADTTLNATDGTDTQVGTDLTGSISGISGATSANITFTETAPSEQGTYYYYAYVVPLPGEGYYNYYNYYRNTDNNTSSYVTITVSAPPDLTVNLFRPRRSTLAPGERFTLDATVSNVGTGTSAATQLRVYEESDDRYGREQEITRQSVRAISANGSSAESIQLTAPLEAGTYYYRVRVDTVTGETETDNNYSSWLGIVVFEPLVLESLRASKAALKSGESFTLTATVKNDGTARSDGTTVRYYRSDDNSLSSRDTRVDSSSVSELAAGGTTQVSTSLTAPQAPGTYYYGACVGDSQTYSGDACKVIRLTVLAVVLPESERPPMYWIDTEAGVLQSLTGPDVQRLVQSVQNATGIVVDIADDRIYWIEQTGDRSGRIQSANVDGTNPRVVKELTSVPMGIALDAANSTVYITNGWGKVQSIGVDGGNFQPDLITGLDAPRGIAVDAAGGKIYWTEQTSETTGKIQSADLNGANVRDVLRQVAGMPKDIAVDAANGKLYVANAQGQVQRLNLDGSGFQSHFIQNLSAPQGVAVDTAAGKVYWTEAGSIRRANLDGTVRENVVTGLGTPASLTIGIAPVEVLIPQSQRPPIYWQTVGGLQSLTGATVDNFPAAAQNATGLVVDAAAGKVYWTEQTSKTTGRIRSADLNGSNPRVVKELKSVPMGIALDAANGRVYITNGWGKVQSLDMDGGNFRPNLITGLDAPTGVAVDAAAGKVYWIEQTGDRSGRIQSANVDGTGIQVVRALTSVPMGIALDAANGRVYITNSWGKVQSLDVGGGDFRPNLITGLDAPTGVAVDAAAGKVYWAARGKIQRANLDGKNLQDVVTGVGVPMGIALNVSAGGNAVAAAPAAAAVGAPNATALLTNYPNPFNPETWIPYQLQTAADVLISIYDTRGVLVRQLSLGHQVAGHYLSRSRAAYWDGRNEVGEPVASGLYFYTLTAGDFTATRKMLILK